MILFNCDYSEGAHADILRRLAETSMQQTAGYGEDPYCDRARELIANLCGRTDLDIHFLIGGTQTNFTVIAAALRPHQCVLCADAGHINVHESGAVEACGHKVSAIPSLDGKLTARQIEDAWHAHWDDETHEHMPQPRMVYISQPTELGTIYSRRELQEISEVCRRRGLYLYMDGARLGYGLCDEGNDLDLPAIASLCDAFYIGGTKVGALFGEAAVFTKHNMPRYVSTIAKQHGALLAKGRLLGLQFLALLNGEDGTGSSPYYTMAAKADRQAMRIRAAFEAKGCAMLFDSPTNQQFPILTQAQREKLGEKYAFSFWEQVDEDRAAVRFCTSWATREEDVDALVADIANL